MGNKMFIISMFIIGILCCWGCIGRSSGGTDVNWGDPLSGSVSFDYGPDTIIRYLGGMADERITFMYDAEGRLLTITTETSEGSGWEEEERYTYTYDGSGRIETETVEQNWFDSLEPQDRYTYNYDIDGKVETKETEWWTGASWSYLYDITFTYDGGGKLTQDTWGTQERHTYTYDGNGRIETIFTEKNFGTWEPYERITVGFDGGGRYNYLMDEWYEDPLWKTIGEIDNTYNTYGRLSRMDQWVNFFDIFTISGYMTVSYNSAAQPRVAAGEMDGMPIRATFTYTDAGSSYTFERAGTYLDRINNMYSYFLYYGED